MSTITTPSPETASPLKRLISGHPLLAFFVIAFAGYWIVMLPLVLAQNALGLLPYTVPPVGPSGQLPLSYYFVGALGAIAGPTLASFVVTAITTGTKGVRQLLRRYMLWRVGVHWYLLVLVGLPLIQLAVASVFLGIAPLTAFVQQWPLFFTTFLPNVLLIGVTTQIWEEGGWSGYAVPALQQRFGAWRACLVLGPLWAVWHLPFFLVPGVISATKVDAITLIVQMAFLIIGAIPIRMIMTWIFNNTKGSILIAILFHSAMDASNVASPYIRHVLSASQLNGYGLGNLLFLLVAAIVLLIFTKGRLSYKQDRNAQLREEPQPAEIPQANIER